jgi:hypothetical protein
VYILLLYIHLLLLPETTVSLHLLVYIHLLLYIRLLLLPETTVSLHIPPPVYTTPYYDSRSCNCVSNRYL